MRILMTGSSGFIGSHLASFLKDKGHEVVLLRRGEPIPTDYFDAVIHLAGANISKRWTAKYKQLIASSRIDSTRNIIEKITPPKLFLCASAVGYYTGSDGKKMTEHDLWEGNLFLSKLTRQWEAAALAIKSPKTRVACMRFGVVLSKEGGMLGKLLPSFKIGLGAILGKQLMSWISMHDLLRAIEHILSHEELEGPINMCTPSPISQEEFAKSIANKLRRPLFLRMPKWLLIFLLGEMAKEVILPSIWAYPEKLLSSGFKLDYNTINSFTNDL